MSDSKRPTRSDGDQTRERILEAAGRLIAANGFADTPVKAIAKAARVDQASINYHFGSRSGLYQAILIESHRRAIRLEILQAIDARTSSPSEKIRALIEEMVKAIQAKGSWHAAVFAREVLSPSANLKAVMNTEVLPKAAFLRKFISSYTGIPQDHPMLGQCLISILAPCLMLMIARRGIPGPVKEVLTMPQGRLADHLYDFAIAGLGGARERYMREG
jgi:AcrR family transcriptional regulator